LSPSARHAMPPLHPPPPPPPPPSPLPSSPPPPPFPSSLPPPPTLTCPPCPLPAATSLNPRGDKPRLICRKFSKVSVRVCFLYKFAL
jgi:hypothetical protein